MNFKFHHIADAKYLELVEYYKTKGHLEADTFLNFLYNAAERYVETGDFTHLNNAVKAGKATQRYRKTMRVVGAIACHKFNKQLKLYYGKADSKKLEKLRKLNSWMGKFKKAIDDEKSHESQTPVWNWDMKKKALIRTIKEATKHGVSHEELLRAVREGEQEAIKDDKAA